MFLKIILSGLGIYYLIFGLWSIIEIESFSDFTRYQGDFFLKTTAGVLFSVLGAIFVYTGLREKLMGEVRYFAISTALGIMSLEIYYLPKIGNPFPFWIDFGIEGIFVVLLLTTIFFRKPF